MFKKSPLKATRLVRRKRKILLWKIGGCVVLVGLVFGGIVWLSHAKFLQISTIEAHGSEAISAEEIEAIAQKNIQGNYIGMFPKSNIFLYPKDAIQKDIAITFPRLASVKVSKHHFYTVVIDVKERTPQYTYCTGMPDTSAEKKCFFMDEDGYVFSGAPIFSGNPYFVFYGLLSDAPIGGHFLDRNKFKLITDLQIFLESQNVHPYALVASLDGSYSIYIGKGTRVFFKDTAKSQDLIGNLDALIQDSTLLKGRATSSIDYIDLRFGNKIYYRYIGDNSAKVAQ